MMNRHDWLSSFQYRSRLGLEKSVRLELLVLLDDDRDLPRDGRDLHGDGHEHDGDGHALGDGHILHSHARAHRTRIFYVLPVYASHNLEQDE